MTERQSISFALACLVGVALLSGGVAALIAGEWFFDPHMEARTLPAFLQKAEAA